MESVAVHVGLFVAFVLAILSIMFPAVGYALLVLVCLGIASLITVGVCLWWKTRYKPTSDYEMLVHLGMQELQRDNKYQLTSGRVYDTDEFMALMDQLRAQQDRDVMP